MSSRRSIVHLELDFFEPNGETPWVEWEMWRTTEQGNEESSDWIGKGSASSIAGAFDAILSISGDVAAASESNPAALELKESEGRFLASPRVGSRIIC